MLTFVTDVFWAVSLFASTNVDDIVILSLFFSQPGRRAASIVAGQFIGIGGLTLGSIIIAKFAIQVNQGWVPYLGLIPIFLGVKQLVSSSDDEKTGVQANWLSVAAVTFANGADNIGTYVPVFATQSAGPTTLFATVFFLLTCLWCWLARWAVDHPQFGLTLRNVLSELAPWVLIAIGLWILRGAL